MEWGILGLLVGILIGLKLVKARGLKPKFLSTNEYWVYLPGDKMPPQDQVMTLLLGDSPYTQKGRKPISPREGLLMSDIRLHIALVLRSKNAYLFRPDLFDEHVEPTAEILAALSETQSLVKVRYVSDTPLKDLASVQLLPHMADSVARLGKAEVIYDCMKEQLYSTQEFQSELASNLDSTNAEFQVRSVWRRAEQGGWAETRGLRKIGLPELVTDQMETDEQVLVTELLDGVSKKLWDEGKLVEKVEVNLFDDQFHVSIAPSKDRISKVKITRVQAV